MRYSTTIKSASIIFAFMLILNVYLLPSALAITVEEVAGNKKKNNKTTQKTVEKSAQKNTFYRKKPGNDGIIVKDAKKDPRLACILSLMMPGAGHIYLRRDLKGIGFCVAAGAGYAATGYYVYASFLGSGSSERNSKLIITGLLFFITAIIHIIGVIEAYDDAEEINKENVFTKKKLRDPFFAKIIVE